MTKRLTICELVVTAGIAGTGSTTSDKVYRGEIKSIYIVHGAASAATTDTTIAAEILSGVSRNVLVIANSNASLQYQPQAQVHTSTGAGAVYIAAGEPVLTFPIVCGRITASVADQTNTKVVTVYVYIDEY